MATNNKDEIYEQIPTLESLYARQREEQKRKEKMSSASFGTRSEYDKKCILLNRSVDCMHVSEYLHDYLFPSFESLDEYPETSTPTNEKRELNQQLMIKENATDKALELSLENRNLEEKLFAKKIQLKDSIKKRNESWNKAVKVFNDVSGKSRISSILSEEAGILEDSENSSSLAEDYEARNISPERMRKELQEKYLYIQEISSVLHRLIVFSGIKWAQQKNLLDIVLCTGKILNTPLNKHNPRQLEKFVFDCMQRLDQVNWKHTK